MEEKKKNFHSTRKKVSGLAAPLAHSPLTPEICLRVRELEDHTKIYGEDEEEEEEEAEATVVTGGGNRRNLLFPKTEVVGRVGHTSTCIR